MNNPPVVLGHHNFTYGPARCVTASDVMSFEEFAYEYGITLADALQYLVEKKVPLARFTKSAGVERSRIEALGDLLRKASR